MSRGASERNELELEPLGLQSDWEVIGLSLVVEGDRQVEGSMIARVVDLTGK